MNLREALLVLGAVLAIMLAAAVCTEKEATGQGFPFPGPGTVSGGAETPGTFWSENFDLSLGNIVNVNTPDQWAHVDTYAHCPNSSRNCFGVETTTALGGEQWCKLEVKDNGTTTDSSNLGAIFRHDGTIDGTNRSYHVIYRDRGSDPTLWWVSVPNDASSFDTIQSTAAFTPTLNGNWFHTCVYGTGAGTTVKIWNNSATEPANCTDTCANNCGTWGPADVTFTDAGAWDIPTNDYAGMRAFNNDPAAPTVQIDSASCGTAEVLLW
jgi:hypothetical protein